MKILIVGGTGFLGGAIAAEAHSAGHDVTIISRGLSPSKLDGVRHIVAERHGPLTQLDGLAFDVVADTCAFGPETVRHLLKKLKGCIGAYAFISSISAYADLSVPKANEQSPVSQATPEVLAHLNSLPTDEKGNRTHYNEYYGPLKAEAEHVALKLLPKSAMVLRAGMLVGAGDPYDRFGYWVRRVDQGGDMAVPGTPDRPVQLIDVRDIAAFIFLGQSGVFNLTGKPMPFLDMLNAIKKVSGSEARFHWVSDEAIAELGINGWTDFPLWLPDGETAFRHILNVDVSMAFAHGLKTRPIEETAGWVLQWDRERRSTPLKSAVTAEIEKKLLASTQ